LNVRIKESFKCWLVAAVAVSCDAVVAQPTVRAPNQDTVSSPEPRKSHLEAVNLTRAEAMVMLDYQVIKVPNDPSLDLMGFHFLNRMNDWLYLGVGGYAPLLKGEYGGFMAFDVSAHAQRKLVGQLFLDGGLSAGGGGGGRSVQQSKILSGTGGFVKGYAGLGYDFGDFSVGANVSRMKFTKSAIDNTQLNVYVQVPFSYSIGSYSSTGDRFLSADGSSSAARASENVFTLALDNYRQIDPQGSNTGTINVADLQFSHFMTKSSYWYFSLGVGYHGLPLYNQILGGVGYRLDLSPRVKLLGQLGIGSGGYAPEKIDTGPGILVYPKLSAEYMLDKNFGLALSTGYLAAPKGSSKNHTFGAALNYHLQSEGRNSSFGPAAEGVYRGYRLTMSQETEFNVESRGLARSNLNMLSAQVDHIVNDHVYLPIRAGVAYNTYIGYPGYGELLAGVGMQTRYATNDGFQFFGQLLAGTNVHGLVAKPGIGLNYSLGDRLAIHAILGKTIGVDDDKFKSGYAGLGLTYRFSVPSM
jgi:hypothetical protein